MLKQTKKAFTLVELIIVITILAILATIGFVSFQGYTADSRNSKRLNDISGLQSKVEVRVAKDAIGILNFASWTTSNALTTWLFRAGSGTTLTWGTNYQAWDVNYVNLQVDPAEFKDPGTGTPAYKFGGAVTTLGNIYQFAATLETTNTDVKKSFIKGIFLTGGTTDNANGLIKASTGTTAAYSLSGITNGSTSDFAY